MTNEAIKLTDEEYIRKGVELVSDDFCLHENTGAIFFHGVPTYPINPVNTPEWFRDALAAQLARQVDATERFAVWAFPAGVEVVEDSDNWVGRVSYSEGDNRTMNTIKAIVDSGVLE